MGMYGKSSTQAILYPYLVLAQCFALFPVTGIRGSDFRTIRFSWKSKRMVFALFHLTFNSVNLCLYFIKQLNSVEFLPTFIGLIYFTTTLLNDIFFIGLARNWLYLMEKWAEIDLRMASYSYSSILSRKLKITSIFVISAAFGEHGLFLANRFSTIENNVTGVRKIDVYLKNSYDQVFNVVPYNIYLGIFMEIFDICCVFAWNYKDLFIMLISMTLSERYSQIYNKIRLMSKYEVTEQFHWRSVREDYIRLNALCKLVDYAVTSIILLSFTHNLFVVLIQFMYTLLLRDQIHVKRYYFTYSFGFLIIRTICVCFFAAQVYHESRKPLEILTSLPWKIYNIEVERLTLQIARHPGCLSGGEFFVITRSLILRITGAIVTYELVLMQIYNYR